MFIGQIEIVTKLVENGIVAAAFLYILHWLLNKQSKETAERCRKDQISNLEIASSIRTLANAVTAMQQLLLTHDLTVSGLNPEAGSNVEGNDSLAYRKYNDVMQAMEEQRELLRNLNKEADRRMAALQDVA